ncbi:hypothetical protein DPMN_182902 [Dreissena polymorpha]|uniref:Neurotransmitter-gated ion-channel ligand-binding domain-containing protein n=1 Tax=Dreissena polymorpha TaxID=45954 RepID=A0A9D4DGL0_DREPO|nr:hypothetical protein DPMN_182902 [Dreissena polymorpha]
MNIMWILCVIVMVLSSFQVEGNMSRLYTHMTSGYNKLLLPVKDHRTQVNVSFQPFLVSINSFDEINGEIALTCIFSLEWTEERMSWNPVEFDNITSFVLPASEIWYPRILLQQSAGSIQVVGASEHSLRIFIMELYTGVLGTCLKSCAVSMLRSFRSTHKCVTSALFTQHTD